MTQSTITLMLMLGCVSGYSRGFVWRWRRHINRARTDLSGGVLATCTTGTSLAILLPPVGLAAVIEYYRHSNVDLKAALVVGAALFVGGWCGAVIANHVSGPYLRLPFGIFVVGMGFYLIFGALRRLSWI